MNEAQRILSTSLKADHRANAGRAYPEWLLQQANVDKWSMPDLSKYENQARLYSQLSWISTAIDMAAQTAAGSQLSVLKRNGEKQDDIPNHPLELLLQNPNPEHGQFELMQTFFSWYKLSGMGYFWLNRSSENEPPAEIWAIPSNKILPVPDNRMWLKGYTYDTGAGLLPLEPYEVLHLKNFNPFTKYLGLSALESLALASVGDLSQQKYTANLFGKDNAKIPGALAFADRIEDGQWQSLKDDAKANWGGTKQAGPMFLRGVGAGGVQWVNMALSQRDMQFIDQRQFTKEEIWSKLAPGMASILDPNATEANATAGKAVFIEYCIWPMLVAMAQKITNTFLPSYGDNLIAQFDDIRMSNRLIDLQEQLEYSKSHTIKEIREEHYGDEPLGDERDLLLPAQINASTGKPAPEAAAPAENDDTATDQKEDAPDEAAVEEELKAWERFALKRVGGRSTGREFEPRAIPIMQAARIKSLLSAAGSAQAVKAIFAEARSGKSASSEIAELANAIREATKALG